MFKVENAIVVAAATVTVAMVATTIDTGRSWAAMMRSGSFGAMMIGGHDDHGMMSGTMRSRMMGRGGGMMGHCTSMMSGDSRGSRPNDQWRNGIPSEPNKGE
jgi:hypothetical protein